MSRAQPWTQARGFAPCNPMTDCEKKRDEQARGFAPTNREGKGDEQARGFAPYNPMTNRERKRDNQGAVLDPGKRLRPLQPGYRS